MGNLESALRYAELGFHLIPLHWMKEEGLCSCGDRECPSPAKHPLTPNGFKDGTTDLATVQNWWGAYPEANIGLVTGQCSGIVVLDIDAGHGGFGTLDELVLEQGHCQKRSQSQLVGADDTITFLHPAAQ